MKENTIGDFFTLILVLLIVLTLTSAGSFIYEFSTTNTFKQYVNQKIEKNGGLTTQVLEDIHQESYNKYGNRYEVIPEVEQGDHQVGFGERVSYTINGKFTLLFIPLGNINLTFSGSETSEVRGTRPPLADNPEETPSEENPAVTYYTAVFNTGGGSTIPSQTVEKGSLATLPTNPVRSGYSFREWSPKIESTPVNTTTVFVAQWNPIVYESAVEKGGTYEFIQYADLAPVFETYGLDKTYTLTLELKSTDISKSNNMVVYMQNGSSTKYQFVYKTVKVGTTYQQYVFKGLKPVLSKATDTKATLAFYGTYHTGNYPLIRNVKIELEP